ncbi:hypothetical protein [Olsenella sp. AGMB03486]|uniref:hypothetical protein n=1 Tax=Olsenella sp. AGMB03486 TaxID=3230364 RepID=UPI0034A03309
MIQKKHYTPDGQEITEEMINRWNASYEKGEFPKGEHTVGGVVHGRPPLSQEGTVTFSVKIPVGMKAAIERAAKDEGTTPSAFARDAFTDKLLGTA